jgi:dolichol-phosphate mannosyltransferase
VAVNSTILFVMDRSNDDTLSVLRRIANVDQNVKIIALASRFGHQMSLLAGIKEALDSDAIIMMDSDLQHPPELIPKMLNNFNQGFEVVYTRRISTKNANYLRKTIGNIFYALLQRLSEVNITPNSSDFRLISKRVASILANDFKERNMFLRGIFSWMGFRQIGIEYEAGDRIAGESKYSFSKMMHLAVSGILSFSTKPLQISIFFGVGFAVISFIFMIVAVLKYFSEEYIPSGWTTLVVLLLLFSGIQLIVLGIIGAYIGGIYEEVKNRPHYIIEEKIGYYD